MKIGIVTTWFERGASYVSKQYLNLLQEEHEVFIYARGFRNTPESESWNQNYVYWGKESVLPVPMAMDKKDFTGWIRNHHLDIVFFNEQQWWPPVLWAQEAGVITGAYVDYYTEETVPLFEAYDFLICNTRRHFEAFNWHPQVFYIQWGTDIDLFKPKSFEPVGDIPTFFQSCGYSPIRKGTDFVLEAFAKIKQPAKLVIHAQVDLVKELSHLQGIIKMLMYEDRLEVIQETVPAPGLYHLGDAYVAPSRLEGIGLTAAEAISCGLPFITTDFPPMNEFVTSESGRVAKVDLLWARKDGYYWPQCRPQIQSLADQLTWYVDNFAQLSEYKKKARKFAEANLNWSDRKSDLNKIFAKVKRSGKGKKFDETVNAFERSKHGIRYTMASRWPLFYKLLSKI
ncbi:MAG: glycosyltransferase family 4 protein [Bacteroidota bacterium]